METTDQPAVQAWPTAFALFIRESCRLPLDAFRALLGVQLPLAWILEMLPSS